MIFHTVGVTKQTPYWLKFLPLFFLPFVSLFFLFCSFILLPFFLWLVNFAAQFQGSIAYGFSAFFSTTLRVQIFRHQSRFDFCRADAGAFGSQWNGNSYVTQWKRYLYKLIAWLHNQVFTEYFDFFFFFLNACGSLGLGAWQIFSFLTIFKFSFFEETILIQALRYHSVKRRKMHLTNRVIDWNN